MTIRQRAHHLLCTLIAIGKGHTPAFAGNDDKIVAPLFPKPAMAICGCNFPIVIARVLDETPVFTYKGAIPDACFRLNSLQTWFAGFRGKRQNHI